MSKRERRHPTSFVPWKFYYVSSFPVYLDGDGSSPYIPLITWPRLMDRVRKRSYPRHCDDGRRVTGSRDGQKSDPQGDKWGSVEDKSMDRVMTEVWIGSKGPEDNKGYVEWHRDRVVEVRGSRTTRTGPLSTRINYIRIINSFHCLHRQIDRSTKSIKCLCVFYTNPSHHVTRDTSEDSLSIWLLPRLKGSPLLGLSSNISLLSDYVWLQLEFHQNGCPLCYILQSMKQLTKQNKLYSKNFTLTVVLNTHTYASDCGQRTLKSFGR